jgi:hypothetical protein
MQNTRGYISLYQKEFHLEKKIHILQINTLIIG